ncbi:CAAD domain-containing protein [Gloeocapsopsis crepidinum LEGE 06123]|uniref:CAAD domain-containing protein n=1 Tax=Gloeocapsopsis crepidinum LEGE 06123 TaxID=588587 RepID=A0ABR9UX59_9CHRO|nr:CAAD domain-containing protein [Gloeocapsopsis crepidinum]MBE9192884.1 CAAD domain-containing protein [Gloeocapsopsis crepidinum LEGE 06123]
MESQVQPPEYANPTSSETIGVSDSAPLATLPPSTQDEQWRRVGSQISEFLAQLPEYIGRFFNEYKQPIITVGLILAAIITVKVVLAVLDALNDIPLLAPTFELVGIGYSVWFVNRYLLQASKRQELSQELQSLKKQVIGSQQLPES